MKPYRNRVMAVSGVSDRVAIVSIVAELRTAAILIGAGIGPVAHSKKCLPIRSRYGRPIPATRADLLHGYTRKGITAEVTHDHNDIAWVPLGFLSCKLLSRRKTLGEQE